MKARFRDLVVAEWIRFWSLRSTRWGLLVCTVLILYVNISAAFWDETFFDRLPVEEQRHFYALGDAFQNNAYLFMIFAMSTMGALSIVGELSSGLIRTTFAAVPDRRAVLLAKAAVVGAVFTLVGAFIALTSFFVTQAILADRHVGLSITDPGVPRAVLAAVLLAPVCALTGLGIGTVLRHPATTAVFLGVLLLLVPQFTRDDKLWKADIRHTMIVSAWQRLADIWPAVTRPGVFYPPTLLGSWVVYAAWPIAALALALITLRRRDV
ncbi:ABC transporter permease [Hamadaea tsunoensis]|uniref:ABC transporter permease n=1 Tax=Hamadaea tsunoensis TaxID=53368 RepID=UPI0003FF2CD7|nr:ABC transporter permease [Hamadaea tsunoensis]